MTSLLNSDDDIIADGNALWDSSLTHNSDIINIADGNGTAAWLLLMCDVIEVLAILPSV